MDVTGVRLDDAYSIGITDEPAVSYMVGTSGSVVVRVPQSRVIARGITTGTERMSPVQFSIELDPQDIDPEADYVILAKFSYEEFEDYSSWGANYRNTFDSEESPTPVLTKGHPSKNVVVPLKVLGNESFTIA